MKCAIIDDEKKAVDVLELYVNKVEGLHLINSFTDPIKASQFLEKETVDLLFLDINMQGLNGFELLESLSNPPIIIFTTAYSEYAVQSYTVNAVDYLVKPITFSRFIKAINKAEFLLAKNVKTPSKKRISDNPSILSIKSGTVTHRIPADTVLFAESEGNYMKVVTKTERILTLNTMQEMLKLLGDAFFQCHRSYIVSENKINKMETHQLSIEGHTIPIGASYRREVLARLNAEE